MSTDLKERREQLLAQARQVVEKAKAENRDHLGADEAKTVDDALAEVRSIDDTLKARQRTADIMAGLDAMVPSERTFDREGHITATVKAGADSRLAFGKATAAAAAGKIMPPGGTKALAPSGATVVQQELRADPIALGAPATGLLDVLPVVQHPTQEYAYLRQTTRTNLAAVVPEGQQKPTSVYSVERVEQSLAVIAHLSEGVPRYWMLDNQSLQQFLTNELQYGLQVAVEAKVLTDISATDGIQAEVFDTSALVTLRKAITKLEVAGHTPAAIVVNPLDWEGVELALATTNAVEHLSLPYDPAQRRLFGVPVSVAVAEGQGTAHVLGAGAVALDTDQNGVTIGWSETSNATDFEENLIRARCEGRFGTSVYSPLGVVEADMGAGSS